MVNRVLRDDPTKSGMHNRQGLTLRKFLRALSDWKLWPLYILGLTHQGELFPKTLSRRNRLLPEHTLSHSPRYPTTDIPHAIAPQTRIQHHASEPPQHPVYGARCNQLAHSVVPQRGIEQSHRNGHTSPGMGFAPANCPGDVHA